MSEYPVSLSFRIEPQPGWNLKEIVAILKAWEEREPSLAPAWYKDCHPGVEHGMDFSQYLEEYPTKWSPEVKCTFEQDKRLWIRSTGECSVETVAHAIHVVMSHYALRGYIAFEWSSVDYDPDKVFYGGAVFITAQQIMHHTTYEWIEEQREDYALAELSTSCEAQKAE